MLVRYGKSARKESKEKADLLDIENREKQNKRCNIGTQVWHWEQRSIVFGAFWCVKCAKWRFPARKIAECGQIKRKIQRDFTYRRFGYRSNSYIRQQTCLRQTCFQLFKKKSDVSRETMKFLKFAELVFWCFAYFFCLFGCRVKQKATRWFALRRCAYGWSYGKIPRFLTIFFKNSQIYEKMKEKTASGTAFSPVQALLCSFL